MFLFCQVFGFPREHFFSVSVSSDYYCFPSSIHQTAFFLFVPLAGLSLLPFSLPSFPSFLNPSLSPSFTFSHSTFLSAFPSRLASLSIPSQPLIVHRKSSSNFHYLVHLPVIYIILPDVISPPVIRSDWPIPLGILEEALHEDAFVQMPSLRADLQNLYIIYCMFEYSIHVTSYTEYIVDYASYGHA